MANVIKLVFIAVIVACADQSFAKEEVERYERASTKMVTAYSLGPIDQCSDIGSPGIYCGVKYKVPAVVARFAGQFAKDEKLLIHAFTNNPKLPVSTKCANDIKTFYCNAFFPHCNSANKTVTFNLQNCDHLGKSCPKEVYDGLHKIGSCNILPIGTFKANKCVKAISSGTKLCPKPNTNARVPQWLSHEDQFNDKAAQNLKAALIKGNTSSECIAKMVNFICTAQSFCSPDGKTLLTTGTQSQCNAALNCLPPKLKQSVGKYFACSPLPDENTAKNYSVPADSVLVSGALSFSFNVFSKWILLGIMLLFSLQ